MSLFKDLKDFQAWVPYVNDVFIFSEYLANTEGKSFRVHGELPDESGLNDVTVELPYIHRWTDLYRSGVLAKFYQLEAWMKETGSFVTMLSLTTYHGYNKFKQISDFCKKEKGHLITIEESFTMLKDAWKKFRDALREYSYVWIMEPHETGYPHLHIVIFHKFTSKEQKRLKRYWSVGLGTSSLKYGAEFTEPPVESIRNYLMKYLSKGFKSSGSKFGEKPEWTPGEWVFNALAKKNKWRFFGATQDLVKVMKEDKTKRENSEVLYYASELCQKDSNPRVMWLKHEKSGWKNHVAYYRMLDKFTDDVPEL